MALFVIGDLHLSLGADKPMDIFPGWEGYLPRLEANWRKLISPGDTVVLAGDTSWAMNLNDTKADFAFIQNLPGQKWLLKGNHDYWWTTTRKMDKFLVDSGFDTLHILHNNACIIGDTALCGTRGWPFDDAAAQGEKLMAREAGRLRMSLQAAGDTPRKIAFLHYPPVYPRNDAAVEPAAQPQAENDQTAKAQGYRNRQFKQLNRTIVLQNKTAAVIKQCRKRNIHRRNGGNKQKNKKNDIS